jgi:hypothetical protein
VGASERRKEIKRRRHRRQKCAHLQKRAEKATTSEKTHIADKLRKLTPSSQLLIDRWNLEER